MSLGENEGHSLGCLLSDAHMSHVIKFEFFFLSLPFADIFLLSRKKQKVMKSQSLPSLSRETSAIPELNVMGRQSCFDHEVTGGLEVGTSFILSLCRLLVAVNIVSITQHPAPNRLSTS